MSLSWSALHAQLLASTNRVEAIRIYEHIRNAAGDALPPGDVSSLLAFLHGSDDDAESKNRALYALVHAGQAEPAWAEVSGTLLLLALWPGLDAVRSRLRRRFPDERKLLDAELVGRMSVAIHDCDLTQVNRIAATLLRNVERDVSRALIRSQKEAPPAVPVEEMIDQISIDRVGLSDTLREALDLQNAQEHLRLLIGKDAHLVLLVVVGGCTQREAAAHLGLSHDAARKRFQRAMARLKKLLPDCPNPPIETAFPFQTQLHRKAKR